MAFKIVVLVFLVLWLGACQEQRTMMNDWKQLNLRGRVKQVEERIYNDYKDLIAKREGIKVVTRFKEDGMTYDIFSYMPGGTTHTLRYEYRSDTAIAKQYSSIRGGRDIWQGEYIYVLDEYNAQQSVTHIAINKEVDYTMQMENNLAGYNTKITYDEASRVSKKACFIERVFDERNSLVQERIFAYEELTNTCKERPLLVSKKNNEQGDLEREKSMNSEGKLLKETAYLYKYDEQGNWIEKQIYQKDQIQQTVLRKIIYYD